MTNNQEDMLANTVVVEEAKLLLIDALEEFCQKYKSRFKVIKVKRFAFSDRDSKVLDVSVLGYVGADLELDFTFASFYYDSYDDEEKGLEEAFVQSHDYFDDAYEILMEFEEDSQQGSNLSIGNCKEIIHC